MCAFMVAAHRPLTTGLRILHRKVKKNTLTTSHMQATDYKKWRATFYHKVSGIIIFILHASHLQYIYIFIGIK